MEKIDFNTIPITDHAKDQYLERAKNFKKGRIPTDPAEEIRWMLSKAEEVKIDPFQEIVRQVTNRKPARYFVYKGWRFVVRDAVITVERVKKHEN